jgi:hypothetical protein
MRTFRIGEKDEYGFIYRGGRGPIQLWETPKGYYGVYLYLENEDYLCAIRKDRQIAETLLDSVYNMLSNLHQKRV